MPALRAGTELEIVVTGSFWRLNPFTTVCQTTADVLRQSGTPIAIRSCVLDLDLTPAGILTNRYLAIFRVTPTLDYADADAVARDVATAVAVGANSAPVTVSVTRIGNQSTGVSVPTPTSDLGTIFDRLVGSVTTLLTATPWVIIGAIVVLLVVIVMLTKQGDLGRTVKALA